MKVTSVIVGRYPMFKEGLLSLLKEDFDVVACFNGVNDLLNSDIDADLVIIDEHISSNLERLKHERQGASILSLSLDKNKGSFYTSEKGISSFDLVNAVRNLMGKLDVDCEPRQRKKE